MNLLDVLAVFWPDGIPRGDYEKAVALVLLGPGASSPMPPRPNPTPYPPPKPKPKPLPNKVDGRKSPAPSGSIRAQVLALLERGGEMSATDIMDRTDIPANSLGSILTQATRKGLVTRRKPPGGGRWLYTRVRPSLPHVPHLNGAAKEANA